MTPVYKRILLKISGEALAGSKGFGIDTDCVIEICRAVKAVVVFAKSVCVRMQFVSMLAI